MLNCVSWRWTALAALALGVGACLGVDQLPNGNGGVEVDSVTFLSVDQGGAHACGVVVGNLGYCWGNNAAGQLGASGDFSYSVPRAVDQGSEAYVQISAGGLFSCALSTDHDAYCWGQNQFGQIGIGTPQTPLVLTPELVQGGQKFTSLSVGGVHVCGLVADGQAWCWGRPGDGQLGNGVSGDTPQPVPDSVHGGIRFRQISAGTWHTCAVTSSGEAYCWGQNVRGELGDGTTSGKDVPTLVAGAILFDVIDVGDEHTCALDLDGNAYCWGSNQYGQLGTGTAASADQPVAVAGGHVFSRISAGAQYTCGVSGDDTYCWGRNDRGELGDGTLITRTEPVQVVGGHSFVEVSTGEGGLTAATCGLTGGDIVYCWGEGQEGQLGTGSTGYANEPLLVAGQR